MVFSGTWDGIGPYMFSFSPQSVTAAVEDDVELHVLECRLTYLGQIMTNAEARFNVALRPQKP